MRKIVFDIETKNIFSDVGGNDPRALDLSVIAIHDSKTDKYDSFTDDELSYLWPILERADMLIGYNSDHFDIPILNKYYPGDLTKIRSLDLMKEIVSILGHRLRLQNVASTTLGISKSADGLQAYEWYKQGKIDEIKKYCIEDVKVTKALYDHAIKHNELKYADGPDIRKIKLNTTNWENGESHAMTHTLGF